MGDHASSGGGAPGRSRAARLRRDLPFSAVLAGAQDGSPWAFRRIFDWLGPGVLGYVRGQRCDDPDLVANEVFVRAFQHIGAFRGDEDQFRSWTFAIARNAVIDERRRGARRVRFAAAADHEPRAGDAEAEALSHLDDGVVRMLDGLTADQRDVVLLRVVADLPVDEVARITGRTAVAVRALHHRAIVALRAALT